MVLAKTYTALQIIDIDMVNYEIIVTINSYICGSLEVTIRDSDNITYKEFLLEDFNYHTIMVNLIRPIKEIITTRGFSITKRNIKDIKRSFNIILETAMSCVGKPTLDYNTYQAHGIIIIGKDKFKEF